MPFRLKAGESMTASLRRIAGEQIDKAVAEIDDDELDVHETVHQVRKRCKKVRGLLRLVRPANESLFDRENAAFRDVARTISAWRDAEAILETFDDLTERFEDELDSDAFAEVRRHFEKRRRERVDRSGEIEERLGTVRRELLEARERLPNWTLNEEGFEAVAGGWKRTYLRGRRAMAEAYEEPSPESFHEWRKRVKDHRYHARLLQSLWKPVLKTHRRQVHDLSDQLGDDHDLAVFREALIDASDDLDESTVTALTGLIDARRHELQRAAATLGPRIYAEKPKQFVRRLERYWQAWRHEGISAPAETLPRR